jgi:hypothetical protein
MFLTLEGMAEVGKLGCPNFFPSFFGVLFNYLCPPLSLLGRGSGKKANHYSTQPKPTLKLVDSGLMLPSPFCQTFGDFME